MALNGPVWSELSWEMLAEDGPGSNAAVHLGWSRAGAVWVSLGRTELYGGGGDRQVAVAGPGGGGGGCRAPGRWAEAVWAAADHRSSVTPGTRPGVRGRWPPVLVCCWGAVLG